MTTTYRIRDFGTDHNIGAPGGDLHANGFQVEQDGNDLLLTASALDFLRSHREEHEDGYIEGDRLFADGAAFDILPA